MGKISPPLGGAAKFWPKNADFAPREALNNVNNSGDGQHLTTLRIYFNTKVTLTPKTNVRLL